MKSVGNMKNSIFLSMLAAEMFNNDRIALSRDSDRPRLSSDFDYSPSERERKVIDAAQAKRDRKNKKRLELLRNDDE